MINLLSPIQKEEIRAARLNVQLRRYVLLSSFVTISILGIYCVGFYLMTSEKDRARQQLSQDTAAAAQYGNVQKEAKTYKINLAIASKVLASGSSYSAFLTSTAQALPAGSILTDLIISDIGNPVPVTGTGTLMLHVRTSSYGGALQVKDSLEISAVFERVSITDIKYSEPTAESTATEKKYPFTLNVSVVITKQKAVI